MLILQSFLLFCLVHSLLKRSIEQGGYIDYFIGRTIGWWSMDGDGAPKNLQLSVQIIVTASCSACCYSFFPFFLYWWVISLL